ncbi:MAG: hypothetical protein PHI30_07790 [Oscillibacter sp.]|nr:hypothetical protein [Oscillibacter sp.]MDD3347587.1 hypothetical protein [Oscillibacter sp.]
MHQVGQRVGPKNPYRLQERGKGTEEKDRAAQQTQQHKPSHFPIGSAQEKQEGANSNSKAVDRIQKARQAGKPAAKRAQQIVQQSGAQAQ